MKNKRVISTFLGLFLLTIGLTSCFYQPNARGYDYGRYGYGHPPHRPHRVVVKPSAPIHRHDHYRTQKKVRSNRNYRAGNHRYN
jgi:hypothetical protein